MTLDKAFLRLIWICAPIALSATGLLLYQDFGVSLDEPAQRLIGIVNLNYVAQIFGLDSILLNPHFANFSNQSLATLEDRHYGVIFELPAALLEVFNDPSDHRAIYHMRHLLTFAYFLVGVAALYCLAYLRYRSHLLGILACLMLIISPRIFADSFYNDKDIVFLATFSLGSLTMIQAFLNPSWKRIILHAFTSGIAIDTRLIGVVIPLMTIGIFAAQAISGRFNSKHLLSIILGYLAACSAITIALWPYLWISPFAHFLEAFEFITRHPHSAAIIFQGREILTNQLPWYYVPAWISISTPILYLILFSIGSVENIRMIFNKQFEILINEKQLIDLIFFIFFLGPIAAISVSHTPIYNGWRHLYFIYPFFILISIKGLIKVWDLIRLQRCGVKILIGVLIANFAYIIYWMTANHPLQNIYFNSLAGRAWNTSYEVDYWGLAHRIALQKILSNDDADSILIWPGSNSKFKSGEPTVFSDQLLLEDSRNRMRVKSPENIEEAKYVIASINANYSPKYLSQHGMFSKFDTVLVDEVEILTIFLRKNYDELQPPKINQKISFAKNEIGIFYLYGNKNPPINWEHWISKEWQIPEDWGTWSNGQEATLRLPINDTDISKLIIKLRAFISPKNPSQNVQLWINGRKIKEIEISNSVGQEFQIDLPKDLNKEDGLRITLKGLSPQSPKKLGLSQDDRQIAIGLESIQLQ